MKRPQPLAMLDCSTGHLSLATRTFLEENARSIYPEIAVREAGFFLSSVKEPDGSLPNDLSFVKRFARENGFDYVLFDADADPIEALPWYGDGNLPDLGKAKDFGLLEHLAPAIIDGQEISAVNHNGIPEGALGLATGEMNLPDGDYVLTEGSAWFTVGSASVHIHSGDDGVCVSIFPLGDESERALSESFVTWGELDDRVDTPGIG